MNYLTGLDPSELLMALESDNPEERFIVGYIDEDRQELHLLKATLDEVVAPLHIFQPCGDGIAPDFEKLRIIDYGWGVAFGEYESSSDAILYLTDAAYREKLMKARAASEQTLGASIRRLRLQRRKTQIEGVPQETLSQIERGVITPQEETLETIAQALNVPRSQLGDY